MKNLILAMIILLAGTSISFAQTQKAAPITVSATKTEETKSATGSVESVTLADPAKGTKSEIVVTGDNGQKYAFLVKSTTTIYAVGWEAITLDKISKSDKVKVKYSTTKEGVNEALSINLMK